MLTAYELVWYAAERTPDQMALVDDVTDRRLTYRELMAEIDAVAAGFETRGVGPGTRVATVLPSLFDHALAILALQRLNAVPALLNFRLKTGELAALVEHGGIEAAIIGADADVAAAMAGAMPAGAMVLSVGGAMEGTEDFSDCRADAAALGPASRPDPEDPAFIFYTSGTTGLPKGVVLSHRSSEPRIQWLSIEGGLRHGTHNRTLGFMPLSHAIGFYGVFLVTLAFSGTYYIMSAFDPVAANDIVERDRITYLFGVPTLLHAMTSAPNYVPERMKSLEHVLFAGGAITPELLDHMGTTWPAAVRHIYGTTETMSALYHPDPVGRPITLRPGYYSRIRVVQMGGTPTDIVEPGTEGELLVDATLDTTFTEYLNRPEITAEKIRDGWYYTGDVCLLRADGDVDLVGRVDDMVRTGGESVHPEEVEAVLAGHDAVQDVSVVGIADDRWGQIVTACIVAEGDVSAEDLDAHCRASELAGYRRPKAYMFMDSLPRNATNKVMRRLLREAGTDARAGGGQVAFHEITSK